MDDSIQSVIPLLISYWQGFGALDVQAKNSCRLLTETIKKEVPVIKTSLIFQEPNENIEELTQILNQLFRTDPNSRQLINILAATADRKSPTAQSVTVLGNNNQVFTVGGNMIGTSDTQNDTIFSPKRNVYQEPPVTSASLESDLAGSEYENKVFVSYAWAGESERVVDKLQKALSAHGVEIVRDKQHLAYKGSIEEFEQRIGKGKCIVLVISDKYLQSKHCMYEFVKIWENRNLKERIFPIVLTDAQIFDVNKRLEYINYWDEQIEQLNKSIKSVKVMANLTETAELDKFVQIRQNFSHLINLVSDMNVLSPELHEKEGFAAIINTINDFMKR